MIRMTLQRVLRNTWRVQVAMPVSRHQAREPAHWNKQVSRAEIAAEGSTMAKSRPRQQSDPCNDEDKTDLPRQKQES